MEHKRLFRFIFPILLILLVSGCGYTSISLNRDMPVSRSLDMEYPRAIVVYDSCSGNTGLIAEVIAEELMAPAVHVDQISGYVMDEYDLVVVGSPVHGGRPTKKIKTFLIGLPKPLMSAVFVTFGAPGFGPATANACLDNMEEKLQETCLGRFKCRGFHKILRTYPSHPDEKDKDEARQFATELLDLCLSWNNAGSKVEQAE